MLNGFGSLGMTCAHVPLGRNFYVEDTIQVARNLLGKLLVRHYETNVLLIGRIIEVEAYLGVEDRAAHSYNGRRTNRTESMFMVPGTSYVYFVYGMHYCFNISTGQPGEAVRRCHARFQLMLTEWK
eukprot:jgi/Galph1/2972/GphlegSOOS_G1645.1